MRRRLPNNECWIGACAGCGRTLISATWSLGHGGAVSASLGYYYRRPVFCTRACRTRHEHDVPLSANAAKRRAGLA